MDKQKMDNQGKVKKDEKMMVYSGLLVSTIISSFFPIFYLFYGFGAAVEGLSYPFVRIVFIVCLALNIVIMERFTKNLSNKKFRILLILVAVLITFIFSELFFYGVMTNGGYHVKKILGIY